MAAQSGRAVSWDASGVDQEGCSGGPTGRGKLHHRGPVRTLPMCFHLFLIGRLCPCRYTPH